MSKTPIVACKNCKRKISEVSVNIKTDGKNILDVCSKCKRAQQAESENLVISELRVPRELARNLISLHYNLIASQVNEMPSRQRRGVRLHLG